MSNYAVLLGRCLVGVFFLLAGIQKIGAYEGFVGYMTSGGVPAFAGPIVVALEILAGAALIVGFQTRYAAWALAAFTFAAGFLYHLKPDDQIQMIMFMKNLAIGGLLLVLAEHGAGALSLEAKMKKA